MKLLNRSMSSVGALTGSGAFRSAATRNRALVPTRPNWCVLKPPPAKIPKGQAVAVPSVLVLLPKLRPCLLLFSRWHFKCFHKDACISRSQCFARQHGHCQGSQDCYCGPWSPVAVASKGFFIRGHNIALAPLQISFYIT